MCPFFVNSFAVILFEQFSKNAAQFRECMCVCVCVCVCVDLHILDREGSRVVASRALVVA